MEYISEGLLLGLILSFSFGPVFFTIIETSISYSPFNAISFAFGVFVSDIIFIILSYFFAPFLNIITNNVVVIGWIAALFFIILGIIKISRPKKDIQQNIHQAHPLGYAQQMMKGIIVNGINPALFIFWMTLTNVYLKKAPEAPLFFFSGALLVTFSLDICKSIFANKIFNAMKFLSITMVIKISGIIYILFGVAIAIKQSFSLEVF